MQQLSNYVLKLVLESSSIGNQRQQHKFSAHKMSRNRQRYPASSKLSTSILSKKLIMIRKSKEEVSTSELLKEDPILVQERDSYFVSAELF